MVLIQENEKKKLLIVLSILCFLFLVGIEYSYRQALFDKSVELIKIYSNTRSSSGISFFNFITTFGTASIFIPLYVIIFNFYSLSKSFTFLLTYVLAVYIDNIMKIIYNNPRPYWVDPAIKILACNGGFGNPSGHAYSSSSVYMAFWYITVDNEIFKCRNWLKMLYLIFILFFIVLIMYSRFYLGVHAINQLLYGFTLGILLYIFLFYVIEFQNEDYKQFFSKYSDLSQIALYLGLYICFIIALILVYCLVETDDTYKSFVISKCPNTPHYRILEGDGLSNALLIFSLLGCHIGFSLLYYFIKRENPENEEILSYIHDFTKTEFKKSILRLLFMCVVALPTMIPLIVVSNNASFTVICTFKITIPYIFTFMVVKSIGIYYANKLNLTFSMIPKEKLETVQIKHSNHEIVPIQENIPIIKTKINFK